MKIAIHQNKEIFNHSTTWDTVWINYCEKNNIEYEIVDCFHYDILRKLKKFDILLWHFSHYSLQEMQFARSIILSAKNMGLEVFPDHKTNWHFDDKIAQSYLLESINAPTPKYWTFYTKKSATQFFKKNAGYPLVAKLKSGSGSNNVKLLKNKREAIKFTKTIFDEGINPSPSFLYKTKSNVKSAKSIKTFLSRVKRIPDFIESLDKTKQFNNEKGYVYLQEFIPNDGYDLKVAVVGDKLSFLARDTRKGDFRASGGGTIRYDKSLITDEIRKIAFNVNEKLGFQCMGYDFVIDKKTNTPKIIEISYGFSHQAQLDLGGYWDKQGNWFDKPLNAPEVVIENIINKVSILK